MIDRLGDIRCSQLADDDIPLLAAVTRLSERTVVGRVRRAHGNQLVRNLFDDDWPYAGALLALLTVATARRARLELEIELATALSPATVRRRLDVNGRTLLQNALPELLEDQDDDVESDDERADRSRSRKETELAGQVAVVDLVGAAKVVSIRRADGFIAWLAGALNIEVRAARRRITAAHGRTMLRTALADAWPPRKLPKPGEVLGQLTAAGMRRSPPLVRLAADVTGLSPAEVFERFERAQGNMRADKVVPELHARRQPAAPQASTKRAPKADQAADDVVGGSYRLVRKLGQGGMGEVWEAIHLHLPDQRVVIKREIAGSPESLMREIGTAYGLTHQNICAYKQVGHDPAHGTFLVLEHGGQSLERLIKESREINAALAVEVIRQAAAGLDFAHDHNVLHQDIKPGNILVEESPRGWRIRVSDFGIALKGERGANTAGNSTVFATSPIGWTTAYAAPEQLDGRARRHSDQYSLALVLCSMLERRVFTARYAPGWMSALSSNQNVALQRALNGNPEQRFGTCGDFARALANAS